MKWT